MVSKHQCPIRLESHHDMKTSVPNQIRESDVKTSVTNQIGESSSVSNQIGESS